MPKFVPLLSILKIHEEQINRFGGSHGLRDKELLESAIAQPQATFGAEYLHPTLAAQAAAYLFHICMNHPFLDGNKRTALAVAIAFITVNGYHLRLSQDEAFELVIKIAEHQINKDQLIAFLEQHIHEV